MKIVLQFEINCHLENGFDFLKIGDGTNSAQKKSTIVNLTGEILIRSMISKGFTMWITLVTDGSDSSNGFGLQLEQQSNVAGVCRQSDFDCGDGICVDIEAVCNGFNDCLNFADEIGCDSITCPGSYKCDDQPDVEPNPCVEIYQVCDDIAQCLAGDDEIDCHLKTCPYDCKCKFADSNAQVTCEITWTKNDILVSSMNTTSM
ncbi:uncharacterized protein [Amphiura filiformis]|uniref:uncharacterized protein n=1 Tax=Amphiura filiformis TaxID=82378 RepID=UPI003B21047F